MRSTLSRGCDDLRIFNETKVSSGLEDYIWIATYKMLAQVAVSFYKIKLCSRSIGVSIKA